MKQLYVAILVYANGAVNAMCMCNKDKQNDPHINKYSNHMQKPHTEPAAKALLYISTRELDLIKKRKNEQYPSTPDFSTLSRDGVILLACDSINKTLRLTELKIVTYGPMYTNDRKVHAVYILAPDRYSWWRKKRYFTHTRDRRET